MKRELPSKIMTSPRYRFLKRSNSRGSPTQRHAIIIFWKTLFLETRASISITIISFCLFLPSAEVSRRLTALQTLVIKCSKRGASSGTRVSSPLTLAF